MRHFGNVIRPFNIEYSLLSTLLIGIALRIALAPYTSHVGDVQVYYIAILNMLNNIGMYETFYFTYPPLFSIILFPLFKIFSLFNQFSSLAIMQTSNPNLPILITSPVFNILLKTPIFMFDTLTGFLIYRFLHAIKNKNVAHRAFMLWYLNPLLIFIGAINGQFDIIPTFFLFLAFILLYYRKYTLSGLSIGFGIAGKLFPFYFLFPYFAIIIKNEQKFFRKATSLIYFFLGLFFSLGIVFLPFLLTNTWQDLLHSIFARTTYISSLGGLNLFNIFYVPYFNFLMNLLNEAPVLVNQLLIVIEFIFVLIISLNIFKVDISIKNLIFLHIRLLIIIYLLMFTTNPQYIIWILPFLTVWHSFFNKDLSRILILSICAIIFNLSWNFPFYPLIYYSKISGTSIVLMKDINYIIFSNFIVRATTGLIGVSILISFLRRDRN
jgi:hypothetical protein